MTRDDHTETDASVREDARTDGGASAEGADDTSLDPWGSSTISDYR